MGKPPEYAYSRAGDTLIVAVSAPLGAESPPTRALRTAARLASEAERCQAGPLSERGDSDARLSPEAVRWLPAPHRVVVFACVAERAGSP